MSTDNDWFTNAQRLDSLVEKARSFIRDRGFTPANDVHQGHNYYHVRAVEPHAGGVTVYLDSGELFPTN